MTEPILASRLNSMRSRPDLWDGPLDVLNRIRRAATVDGLGAVDLNYPQHLEGIDRDALRDTLAATDLAVGAINLRFDDRFAAGAFTNPDASLRDKAIRTTVEAGMLALDLGARHVIVWPAFDGYDYPFQVDYRALHDDLVAGFTAVADALPDVMVSLEYKPLEPRKFYAAHDMATSLLIARDTERDNVGVTLDVAHSLIAGENPAQAAVRALAEDRLFGLHLNDGFGRADDGLLVGSIHPLSTLELLFELRRGGYDQHVYFDTFPVNEDPVEEARRNVAAVRDLWRRAGEIDAAALADARARQDAFAALDVVGPVTERNPR
ncbi:MAG: TIM barrel protein [Trueperaceae bacterium]|nr:TIM barrel protein [Trueperaceae bacterium]